MAVAESGIAITALVVVGVAPAAMPSIDQGRSKGGADVLHMAQLPQAQQLASAARWLWRWQNERMRQTTVLLRDYELPQFIREHPGLPASLEWGRSIREPVPQGRATCSTLSWPRKTAGPLNSSSWLGAGENLAASSPILYVCERFRKAREPLERCEHC